ncbi:PQQ-like beta-propeller repeat protein [Georgenia satyanarayanai]|uniref:PQQ-like beta-propeller repeat protein n=1 Tax=Georgenia satyanarayanai TaxID=860221 RepID=UPI00203E8287|nr:PQQ-like beta-propeller repeat protein [Georgenia satyanarayanai]MCM3661370.1 PQQ-like beta-propeller repeat protein [Georgenia satyanarayanai]
MTRRWAAAAAVVAVGLLAACSEEEPAVEPQPVPLEGRAPVSTSVEEGSLPLALSGQPVLDPGWSQVPQELDGVLLGLVHPQDSEPLRFVAAGEDGTLLWQAQRPPSCTGFTLTRAEGRPVAVLTDVAPGTEQLTETTASAYDLRTGNLLWGPQPVPGPHQGPGLVFAAPAPGAAMGETGPRVALDPATGEEVALEEGAVVVGEYAGVVLTAGDGVLSASGPETAWQAGLDELGLGASPVALPGVAAPAGTALLGDPGQGGVLLDLASGEVLAHGVGDAVREPLSGTLVTLEGDRVVGYPQGGARWERPAPGARLSAAGNVFAYLRTDTAVQALNVVTGEVAVAYDEATTSPAVPVLVTGRGATVVEGADLALVPTSD